MSCRGLLPETNSTDKGLPASLLGILRNEGAWLEDKGICFRCRSSLSPIEPPYCLLCGRHVPQPGHCPECERETSFVLSRSYGKYEGVLRDLLHRFKFSREDELITILASCLHEAWDLHLAHFPIDWLVPVPIHAERLKERGYNQAERLALHLSSYTKIPCLPALRRHLHLKGQATRDRKERIQALQGTFVCDLQYVSEIQGKRILLVDDIYTTGSTAEACAKGLMDAGVEQVYVITVAR
ncbi:ComF family protein [Effusibacillus consociatus]